MINVSPAFRKDPSKRPNVLTRIVALAILPGVAATLAIAGGVTAQAAPVDQKAAPVVRAESADSNGTVSHRNTLTPAVKKLIKGSGVAAEQKALASYWSADRMKAAKPLDRVNTFERSGSPSQHNGAGAAAKPQGAAVAVAPSTSATAPKAVKAAKSKSRASTSYTYPNLPYYYPAARTNGKVFFTRGGANYVCSASIVNSEGKSLVWTAGHCIVDGRVWDSNFAFVPSYSNGSRPYGTWYSRQLTTTYGWYWNRDFTQDVGAVTLNRNFGYRIADYLGAQGITWNQTPSYWACAFGYPQAPPFTGAWLVQACGQTWDARNGTIYMYSGLTGGSSGGPWLRNFDGNWGLVNGHNDFIYTNNPAYMYSPYYGNQVATLYNAVRYQTS